MAKAELIRRPDFAGGGITADEKKQMDAIAKEWIDIAFRTDPIEPDKIEPAIVALYAAAGLKAPRVLIAPSPLAMAGTYGMMTSVSSDNIRRATAAATSYATYDAIDNAIDVATSYATAAATRSATYNATAAATRAATHNATYDATSYAIDNAIDASTSDATFSVAAKTLGYTDIYATSNKWNDAYQGGNMWAGGCDYIAACRDVLGLELPEFEAYQAWEDCARHGGFRVLHPEFCIVSDFPELIKVDEENRPHCENGPSHRWRDGWEIYHWHGVQIPKKWMVERDTIDPTEILQVGNVEKRAAGAALIGWSRMMSAMNCKIIDDSGNSDIGQLIEMKLNGLPEAGRFLRAMCPRNGWIVEGVPRISDIDDLPIETALAAQAWRIGDPQSEYEPPQRRT